MEKSIPECIIFEFVFEEKKRGLENNLSIYSNSYDIIMLLDFYYFMGPNLLEIERLLVRL